eukprot:scaffold602_cov342-Prasinococcus_capsulatus_cf.AAC.6
MRIARRQQQQPPQPSGASNRQRSCPVRWRGRSGRGTSRRRLWPRSANPSRVEASCSLRLPTSCEAWPRPCPRRAHRFRSGGGGAAATYGSAASSSAQRRAAGLAQCGGAARGRAAAHVLGGPSCRAGHARRHDPPPQDAAAESSAIAEEGRLLTRARERGDGCTRQPCHSFSLS